MLLQIALTNFFSLRDQAVMDFRATNSRTFRNPGTQSNTFDEDGTKLLKSIAIFGANASGKSNFLKAVEVVLRYIRDSHLYTETTVPQFQPFKFHDTASPSSFEMEFVINGVQYDYGFSILGNRITQEYLFSYPKKYKALVFKCETSPNGETAFTFSKKFVRPKEIVANTSPYTLFLTRAASMNRSVAVNILNFVTDRISIGLPSFDDSVLERLLQTHKTTVIEALRFADSDIVNYEFKSTDGPAKRLVTYHKGNSTKPFDFDSEESAGTRRLLRLIVAFIEAAEKGKILVIDELETSLHPQLVKYAVRLFNKSEKAQLIFSTHNLDLLNTDVLRPDQIYFVSKDYENGATELYSLADFSDYKTYRNLRRDYEQGRFNAIPILPSI